MKVNDWLEQAQQVLTATGISTARLDALVLLEDCLKRPRATLLAHTEIELTADQLKVLNGWLARRAKHVPLAYIRHKSEFYGREFYVDERVLEPRPESETIITLLKKLVRPEQTVADIGTGSGMLAITAKLELPSSQVFAVDIDQNCLEVARLNAQRYNVDISFKQGDLLSPLDEKVDILLCNLPYVPDNFQINLAALHEPRVAIFGGPDGLDLYRKLFTQIDTLGLKPGYILAESLPPQHGELAAIASAYGYHQQIEDDFIQLFT